MRKLEQLDVNVIEMDLENPRIKSALDKYGDKVTADRVHFALRSAGSDDNDDASATFNRLKNSIQACGGVNDPIKVIKRDGKYICIDGNTRLLIYREFLEKGSPGNWATIPAYVNDSTDDVEIEKTRISAHLVGARSWEAFEKARYLHDLFYVKLKSPSELIQICGGNEKDIMASIDAYKDMDEHYRKKVSDNEFHSDRFSGFRELQKPGVKQAIRDAGFDISDFSEWIRDGWIYELRDVRKLKDVLSFPKARKEFLKGGVRAINRAIELLKLERSKPQEDNDSLSACAEVLISKIDNIPFAQLKEMKEGAEDVLILEDVMEKIKELLDNISK